MEWYSFLFLLAVFWLIGTVFGNVLNYLQLDAPQTRKNLRIRSLIFGLLTFLQTIAVAAGIFSLISTASWAMALFWVFFIALNGGALYIVGKNAVKNWKKSQSMGQNE